VLSLTGQSGYLFSWGGDTARINDRFFRGGNSFRGFETAGIGPRVVQRREPDEDGDAFVSGDALGGNFYAIGALELAFPLGLPEQYGIRGSLFTEFGTLGLLPMRTRLMTTALRTRSSPSTICRRAHPLVSASSGIHRSGRSVSTSRTPSSKKTMTGRASSDSAREQGSNVMQRQFFAIARSLRIAAAALALALGFTGVSLAQSVLIMNEARILRESAVGQHVAGRLEAIGAEIQAELEPQEAALRAESEALNAETAALSEEAIRQRPDLAARYESLQRDAATFEQTRRIRAQELQATEQQAMRPVLPILQEVLQEIVSERNASVLIDRSVVVFAADSVDITQSAIERLNQRISTTPVNRVRVPTQPAQQQQ
jgi:Skp family chaperone for outer membrane proteins